MYGDQPSERTVRHHFARLADHRITGVVERHQEFAPPRGGERDQRFRVGQRGRQRLVADHIDPRLQEGRCDRCVQMVGGNDDDRLDAVRPACLAFGHDPVVGIAAVGPEADLGSRGRGVGRVCRQGAGDQLDLIVETHRQAMDGADEGVAAAADHADPEPPAG